MKKFELNNYYDELVMLEDSIAKAEKLKSLAFEYWKIGYFQKAYEINQMSLDLSYLLNYKLGIANAYNFKAYTHYSTNDSMYYYFKALDIFEEINDYSGIASIYNNIGLMYKKNEDYEMAMNYFQKSLKVKEMYKVGSKDITYSNIANIYAKQFKYQEAVKLHQEVIDRLILDNNYNQLALNYLQLAEILYEMNKYTESLETLEKIQDAKLLEENINLNAYLSYFQGLNYCGLTFYESAKSKLEQAHNISVNNEIDELITDSLKSLYNVSKKEGETESALEYLERYLQAQKDILKKKRNKELSSIKEIFEFEKQELFLSDRINNLEKIKILSSFTAGVSDKISNPMTSLMIKLNFVLIKAMKEPNLPINFFLQDLHSINEATSQIDDMIKRIYSFLDLKENILLESINLNEFLDTYFANKNIVFNDNKILFSYELLKKTCLINCVKDYFSFVLDQIFLNAIQEINALETQRIINVHLFENNKKLNLKIHNNGSNLNEEQVNCLFDFFYTTKKDKGNLGLGLSLVKIICDALKISLILENEKNQGFAIILQFPDQINS